MNQTAALEDAFDRVFLMPYSPQQRAEAEALVAAAQDAGDVGTEFKTRMLLVANGVMTGASELVITHFAWALAKHKEDPARFVSYSDEPSDSIFWQFKWIPSLMVNNPSFSREQIMAVLDDMDATFRAAGQPRSAVVTARLFTHIFLGDVHLVDELADQMRATPRDPFSSCEACAPSHFIDIAELKDDHEEAVRLALEIWDSGAVCAEEPEGMLSQVLASMLVTGQLERAPHAAAYVRYYATSDPDKVSMNSALAHFYSLTGHHEHAFQHLERHLPHLVHDVLNQSPAMWAAMRFANVLERFSAARNAGSALVAGSNNPALGALIPVSDRPYTVDELAAHLRAAAERLAAQFDARNGNTRGAAEMRFLTELSRYETELELDLPEIFQPLVMPGRAETAADFLAAESARFWNLGPRDFVGLFEDVLPRLDEYSPQDRLHIAVMSTMVDVDDPRRATTAVPDIGEAASAIFGPEVGEQVARIEANADFDAAAALAAELADAHPYARARAHLRAARLYWTNLEADVDAPPGIALEHTLAAARISEEAIAAGIAPEVLTMTYASGLANSIPLLLRAGLPDDARTTATALAALEGNPARRAFASYFLGEANGMQERWEEALAAYDAAATLWASVGMLDDAASAASRAGQLLVHVGDPMRAAVRLEFVVDALGGLDSTPPPTRHALADAYAQTEPAKAIPVFENLIGWAVSQEETSEGFLSILWGSLGRACLQAEDPRAAQAYASAYELAVAAEDHAHAAFTAKEIALITHGDDEADEASAWAHRALAELAHEVPPAVEMQVLQAALWTGVAADVDGTARRALDIARELEDIEATLATMRAHVTQLRNAEKWEAVLATAGRYAETGLEAGFGFAPLVLYHAIALHEVGRRDDAETYLWGLREEHLGSDESRRYELSWAAFNFYAQLEEEARAEQYRAGFDPSWGDGEE